MLALVEFPELVQHYAPYFADVFSEAAFVEFQRYISGLIVSENKTVEGINRLLVNESRNQSSLNRLLTVSPFSLKALNRKRHDLLSSLSGTQMKRDGALSVDDTLSKHYGEHFEQIAYLYDHVEQNYTRAHNLVTLHYSDNETDYPVGFQLWKPADLEQLEQGLQAAGVKIKNDKRGLKESAPHKWRQYLLGLWRRHASQKAEIAALYESKLRIAEALLQEWKQSHPTLNLPVSFDSWYTQPAFCHFIEHDLRMNYVGALAEDQQVVLKTGTEKLADFAARLKQEHLDAVAHGKPPVFKPVTIPYKGGKEKYYSYCVTHRIHNVGKKRLVINHRQADLSDNPTCLLSVRALWCCPCMEIRPQLLLRWTLWSIGFYGAKVEENWQCKKGVNMTLQQITIEIPDKVLLAEKTDAESFGREILVLAAVKLFEIGRLSSGRAAELAGMSRVEFLSSLNRYKVFPLAAELHDLESGNA